MTHAAPRPLPPSLEQKVPAAIDRALDLSFSAFKSQVVPYLEAEHQVLYDTPEAWEQMQERVVDQLDRLR